MLAAALAIPIVFTKILSSALTGRQQYDRLAVISLRSSVADLAFIGLAAILDSGVGGILLALIAGSLVSASLTYRSVQPMLEDGRQVLEQDAGDRATLRRAHRFALTESYILFTDGIIWQNSEIFFLKMLSTLPQIAFYKISFSVSQKLLVVAGSVTGVLMPLSSEAYGRFGELGLGRIYEPAAKYTQMIMVPLCGLGMCLAPRLVSLVYGPVYLPLVPVLQVLMAGLSVTCLAEVGGSILYAANRLGFVAWLQTPIAALNIALDLTLIRSHGAMGAAIANVTAQVLEGLILLVFAGRVAGGRFPWRATAKVYGSAALGAIPVLLALRESTGNLVVIAAAIAGCALYLFALILWGELGKPELEVLGQVFGQPIRHWLARGAEAGNVE